MKSRQWSNFLKSLYFNLLPSALLFILVVLLISTWIQCCSSSLFYIYVFACLMQTLSFSLSEIKKPYWITLGLFPVSVCFWIKKNEKTCVWHIFEQIHTFCFHTKQPRVLCFISLNCVFVCVCVIVPGNTDKHLVDMPGTGWVSVCVCVSSVERQQLRLGTYTTGVHCICGHMMPIRQIRAQTDEALLNGSFY